MWTMQLAETNRVPDWLIQMVLRVSLRSTLRRHYRLGLEEQTAEKRALVQKLKRSPIAVNTADPNRQHYELLTEFFQLVLGKRLKYSCCYWPEGVTTIDGAEEAMLRLTCERAGLKDGMAAKPSLEILRFRAGITRDYSPEGTREVRIPLGVRVVARWERVSQKMSLIPVSNMLRVLPQLFRSDESCCVGSRTVV